MSVSTLTDITTRVDIANLVKTFYDRVFSDEQLGPVFTEVARVKPETHFPLMTDF